MRRINQLYFVGIGGSGMGGIAEVLLHQGYRIVGSDVTRNAMVEHLERLGVQVHIGHFAEQVVGSNVLVVSSAIAPDNPEVQYARAHRIPIVQRAQMLAELMRFRQGIAVAGAHGKTTTTSLLASILAHAGLDPTFVIGGRLNSAGTNARLGSGRYLVAEADESDASFLLLHPMIAIVTNIDADHLGTYGGDFQKLKQSYIQFLHNLPFYGLAVMCTDCKQVCSILEEMGRPFLSYGTTEDCDYRAEAIVQEGLCTHFKVVPKETQGREAFEVTLNLAGRHNVLNALAAITVACDVGVKEAAIVEALAQFKGVSRRMQVLGTYPHQGGSFLVMEDYGHHPKELQVTIQAVRDAWPTRRLVMIFQPHRYTRTAELFDDFCKELSKVDVLLMLEVYSAGESPIPGAESAHLCRHIRQLERLSPVLIKQEAELKTTVEAIMEPQDVLLFQGAGSISQWAARFVAQVGVACTTEGV